MKKNTLLIALLCWWGTANAWSLSAIKDIDVKTTELGSGIFELRTDKSGNVVVFVGEEGVLMIDTQMNPFVELINATQKELSGGREVDIIVNTHFHRDHVRGNEYFKEKGAVILAHDNVREYMEKPSALSALGRKAPSFTKNFYPTITIKEGLSFRLNGQNIEVYHAPNAHSNSDLVVQFLEANVVHGGDIVATHRFPFIDIDNGGSVDGLVLALNRIIKTSNEQTQIVSGHGPTATRDDLIASVNMLTETHSIIKNLVKRHLSLQDIIELKPLRKYASQWNWEFIDADRMVTIHYYDITGKLE